MSRCNAQSFYKTGQQQSTLIEASTNRGIFECKMVVYEKDLHSKSVTFNILYEHIYLHGPMQM